MANNFTKNVISAINIKDVKYNIKAVPFHATEAEWNGMSYIPKQGEFIVYDVDSNNTSPRFKTGDGVTDVKNLPFTLATISEVQAYVNSQIGSAGHLKRVVLEDGAELPDVSEANIDTIYMKKNSGSRLVSDVFDEYMVINGNWEIIGSTRVDLSNYTTQEMVDEKIETAISSIDFPEEIYKQNEAPTNAEEGALWLDLDEEAAVSGGSGGVSSWNDLADKPFSVELVQSEPVFNGDIDSFEHILYTDDPSYAVKITRQVVSVADLVGATMTIYTYAGEQTLELTEDAVIDSEYAFGIPGGAVVQFNGTVIAISLPSDAELEGLRLSTGTWIMCVPDFMYPKTVSCLTYFEKSNITPLNKQFLPAINHDEIAPPFVIEIADLVENDTPFDVGTYDAATFDRLVQAARHGVLKINIMLKYKFESNFYTNSPGEITTELNRYVLTPCVFVGYGEYPSITMSAIIGNSVLHIHMNNPEYNGYTYGILKTIAYEH